MHQQEIPPYERRWGKVQAILVGRSANNVDTEDEPDRRQFKRLKNFARRRGVFEEEVLRQRSLRLILRALTRPPKSPSSASESASTKGVAALQAPVSSKRAPLRASLADLTHRIYAACCRHHGLEMRIPHPNGRDLTSPIPALFSPTIKTRIYQSPKQAIIAVAEELVSGHKMKDTEVTHWRGAYRRIMDTLEVHPGLSIRLHTLDEYDVPVTERLSRSGLRGAPAMPYQQWHQESPS